MESSDTTTTISSSNSVILETKLISCKDLKAFNFFQKLCVYAVATIGTDVTNLRLNEHHRQEQRTAADKESDRFPHWNHPISFHLSRLPCFLSLSDLFIHFELFHEGQFFGDKLIGRVRVPLKDLTADRSSVPFARFVDYEVRSPEGKPNGVLNLSYRPIEGILRQSPVINGYAMNHSADFLRQVSAVTRGADGNRDRDRDLPVFALDASQVRYPEIEAGTAAAIPSAPPLQVEKVREEPFNPFPTGASTPGSAGVNYTPPPQMWPLLSQPSLFFLPHMPPPPPPLPPPFAHPPPPPPLPPAYYQSPFQPVWAQSYCQVPDSQQLSAGRYDYHQPHMR